MLIRECFFFFFFWQTHSSVLLMTFFPAGQLNWNLTAGYVMHAVVICSIKGRQQTQKQPKWHLEDGQITVPFRWPVGSCSLLGSKRLGCQSLLHVCQRQGVSLDCHWAAGGAPQPLHPACLHQQRGVGWVASNQHTNMRLFAATFPSRLTLAWAARRICLC